MTTRDVRPTTQMQTVVSLDPTVAEAHVVWSARPEPDGVGPSKEGTAPTLLTPRELDVLHLLVEGRVLAARLTLTRARSSVIRPRPTPTSARPEFRHPGDVRYGLHSYHDPVPLAGIGTPGPG